MKHFRIVMFVFLVISCNHVSLGQSNLYSTISKNINSKASSLYHALNKSGDTLLLKSIYQLDKVEVIGDFGIKTLMVENNIKEAKIPLHTLAVGEYTISVLHTEGTDDFHIYRKTIVFKVKRLLPIYTPNTFNNTTYNEPYLIEVEPLDTFKIKNLETVLNTQEPINKSLIKNPDVTDALTKTVALSLIETKDQVSLERAISTKDIPEKADSLNIDFEDKKDSNERIFVPYSLSDPRRLSSDPRYVIQSRAEYRAANLRPNGKPYD